VSSGILTAAFILRKSLCCPLLETSTEYFNYVIHESLEHSHSGMSSIFHSAGLCLQGNSPP
jgi:hypothetical protein